MTTGEADCRISRRKYHSGSKGLWAVKLNLKFGIDGIDVQLSSSNNSLSGKFIPRSGN